MSDGSAGALQYQYHEDIYRVHGGPAKVADGQDEDGTRINYP